MDLAPFARMDDPIRLEPSLNTAEVKPQRRKRFNEEDDDDDDEDEGLQPKSATPSSAQMQLASADEHALPPTSSLLGEEEKTPDSRSFPQSQPVSDAFGFTEEAEAPSNGVAARMSSPSTLRDVPLDSPLANLQEIKEDGFSKQPAVSPTALKRAHDGVDNSSSPVSTPLKRAPADLITGEALPRSSEVAERNKATEPGVFWAEHREWLRTVARIERVTVDEPIQMARTLTNPNPPVTYLVRTSVCEEGVRRRYSDFEVLRVSLVARFPGVLILALPEKKAVGNTMPEFLKERSKRLELFLRSVVASEYLCADVILRSFVLGSVAEWESAKKRALATPSQTQAPPPMAASSSGTPQQRAVQSPAGGPFATSQLMSSEERWRAAVHMSQLPERHEEEVRRTLEAVSKLELGLKNLATSAFKCAQAVRQSAWAWKELQSAFAFTLTAVQSPMEFWADCAKLEPILIDELLHAALEKELESVSEMRRMLEARQELVMSADQKLAILHKYEDEREQLEKSGQGEKAQRSAQKVQDAMKQVKQADYRLETFTKALFLGGLVSFAPARVESISRALSTLAFGELRLQDLVKSVWLGIVASLRLDPAQLERDAEGPMRDVAARVPDKFKPIFSGARAPTSPRKPATSGSASAGGENGSLLSV